MTKDFIPTEEQVEKARTLMPSLYQDFIDVCSSRFSFNALIEDRYYNKYHNDALWDDVAALDTHAIIALMEKYHPTAPSNYQGSKTHERLFHTNYLFKVILDRLESQYDADIWIKYMIETKHQLTTLNFVRKYVSRMEAQAACDPHNSLSCGSL